MKIRFTIINSANTNMITYWFTTNIFYTSTFMFNWSVFAIIIYMTYTIMSIKLNIRIIFYYFFFFKFTCINTYMTRTLMNLCLTKSLFFLRKTNTNMDWLFTIFGIFYTNTTMRIWETFIEYLFCKLNFLLCAMIC